MAIWHNNETANETETETETETRDQSEAKWSADNARLGWRSPKHSLPGCCQLLPPTGLNCPPYLALISFGPKTMILSGCRRRPHNGGYHKFRVQIDMRLLCVTLSTHLHMQLMGLIDCLFINILYRYTSSIGLFLSEAEMRTKYKMKWAINHRKR